MPLPMYVHVGDFVHIWGLVHLKACGMHPRNPCRFQSMLFVCQKCAHGTSSQETRTMSATGCNRPAKEQFTPILVVVKVDRCNVKGRWVLMHRLGS